MHLLVGRYLEAGAAGLRWRAAQLIGTCSQNVAAIQEQVLGLGALRKLLRLLDRDSCDTVRVKALFAISCECPGSLGGAWGLLEPQGTQGWVLPLSFILVLLGLCVVVGNRVQLEHLTRGRVCVHVWARFICCLGDHPRCCRILS